MKKIKKTLFDNSTREINRMIWAILFANKYKRKKSEKREIIYHRTLKKKNRAKKGETKKNDYVNNASLYEKVFNYHIMKKRINDIKLQKDIIFKGCNQINDINKGIEALKGIADFYNFNNDIIMHDIALMKVTLSDLENIISISKNELVKKYEIKMEKIEKDIICDIYKICKKLIKSYHFRDYGKAENEDMVGFAVEKILMSKPWKSFNVYRSNSVFSFFTRVIFNYYVRYVKKYYRYHGYNGVKQKVLGSIINDFDSKWCKLGINFNLSEGIDFE